MSEDLRESHGLIFSATFLPWTPKQTSPQHPLYGLRLGLVAQVRIEEARRG